MIAAMLGVLLGLSLAYNVALLVRLGRMRRQHSHVQTIDALRVVR